MALRGSGRIKKHSLMGYGIHNSGRMGAFKQTLVPVTRAEMETPTALAVALALRLALLMVASIDTPIPGMPGVPGTAGVSMQTFLTQKEGTHSQMPRKHPQDSQSGPQTSAHS